MLSATRFSGRVTIVFRSYLPNKVLTNVLGSLPIMGWAQPPHPLKQMVKRQTLDQETASRRARKRARSAEARRVMSEPKVVKMKGLTETSTSRSNRLQLRSGLHRRFRLGAAKSKRSSVDGAVCALVFSCVYAVDKNSECSR